jgi:hypothetical protein
VGKDQALARHDNRVPSTAALQSQLTGIRFRPPTKLRLNDQLIRRLGLQQVGLETMSAQTKRPNQIFICYRREDTAGVVGRIYDRLVQRFGKDAIFKDVDSLVEDRRKQEAAEWAAAPAAISVPEHVARADRQDSAETYQHPIQVSPEQERPPVASMVGGSPQTSATASQHVETQTDFWIAAKDRRRIVALYLCLWLVVGLIGTGAHSLLTLPFGTLSNGLYRFVLMFVSLLVGLILAVGQTIILKGYIGPAKRWIGYTVLASGIEGLLRAPFQSVFVLAMLNYLIRGGLQWLLLRKLVKRAWLWIVAGFAVGVAISLYAGSVAVNGFEYVLPLESYNGWLKAWTGPQHLVMALLSSSLIAAAEIVCLMSFRRK